MTWIRLIISRVEDFKYRFYMKSRNITATIRMDIMR